MLPCSTNRQVKYTVDGLFFSLDTSRCFTFGIGSGASTALVEGLARAGSGTAEFVKEGERLQPKVRAVAYCCLEIVTNIGLLGCTSRHTVQRRVPQGLAIAHI